MIKIAINLAALYLERLQIRMKLEV